MKKALALIMVLNCQFALAQDQFQLDIKMLKEKLELNETTPFSNHFSFNQDYSILYVKTIDDFYNESKDYKRLFSSLDNYNLVTNPLDTNHINGLFINLNHVGKRYFDDVYKNYRNDLSSYLPKVPDIFWLCPID